MLQCWRLNTQDYIGGGVEEKKSFSTTGLVVSKGMDGVTYEKDLREVLLFIKP